MRTGKLPRLLSRLLRNLKHRRPHRSRLRHFAMEQMEERHLLATFSGSSGGSALAIALTDSSSALAVSAGTSAYTLTLTGSTWTSSNISGGATVTNPTTLSVNKDFFSGLAISDSANSVTVNFNSSGNSYSDPISVIFDNTGSAVNFNAAVVMAVDQNFSANANAGITFKTGSGLSTSGTGTILLAADNGGTNSGILTVEAGASIYGTQVTISAANVAIDQSASVGSTTPYSSVMLNNSPIAYYRLNESSGTVAVKSGSIGNGTYVNGVGLGASGAISDDTAANFDGVNDYVMVPSNWNTFGSGSGTMMAWINLDSLDNEPIFAKQDSGVATYGVFSVGSYAEPRGFPTPGVPGKLYFHGSNTSSIFNMVANSNANLVAGKYYHVAVVYTPASARFYINGVFDNEVPGNFSTAMLANESAPISTIGAWFGNFLDGRIDEFAIYPTALTASEVAAKYANGNPAPNTATSSVSVAPLLAGRGINLGDATGQLDLTDTELDRITAATVSVGNSATGTITITSPLTQASTLILTSRAGIDFAHSITMELNKSLFASSLSTSAGISLGTATANADISTSGVGTIQLSSTRNISLSPNSSITTVNGGVTLFANQQTTATAGNFVGVTVDDALIQSFGTGGVTVLGKGGSGTVAQQFGVLVTNGGEILGGAATINVVGDGGASSGGLNIGVYVLGAGSRIATSSGNVLTTGRGGGGIGNRNYGLLLEAGGVLSAGGIGTVSVTGVGGGGPTLNNGIFVTGTGSQITSSGGTITVTATGQSASEALRLESSGAINSGNNAAINIIADSLITVGSVAINSGLGITTIRPRTTSTRIDLGGIDVLTGTSLTLGLSDEELDIITAGTLQLGNTTSGPITISAPITRPVSSVFNLTTGSGNNIIFSGSGSINSAGGNIKLTTSGTGAIQSGLAAADITTAAGNVSLLAGSTGIGEIGNPLVASGANIDSRTVGNGNQYLSAVGSIVINASGLNAESGTIELNGGTFNPIGNEMINDSTKLNINGATYAMGSFNETVNTLTLTSGNITGTSPGFLTSTNKIQTKQGSISATLRGANGLTQSTSGTTTLSGNNTYSGTTTVSGGTLALANVFTNNIASSPTIDVQAGALLNVSGLSNGTLVLASGQTLKGTGAVSGKTTASTGSILAPGASPGMLTLDGLTLGTGATYAVEISNASTFDQLDVTGTVTLGGVLNVSAFGSLQINDGDFFKIINNDGTDAVVGTFTGLPEGAVVNANFLSTGKIARITYRGGSGNDVVIGIDRPPSDILLSNNSLLANAGANALIGTLSAIDPDIGDTLIFSLPDGVGSNSLFNIDGNSLRANNSFDLQSGSAVSITVRVTDAFSVTFDKTFSVNVLSVNGAPAGSDKLLTTSEDVDLPITTTDFGFSDADGNLLNRVKITTLPALGTLKLNGVAISAGSFVTKAELDANQLTFTPPLNANGLPYTSFTFQVEDDGGTVGGGVNLDASPNFLTIDVLAVNDSPSFIVGSNQVVLEDSGAVTVPAFTGTSKIYWVNNTLLAIQRSNLDGSNVETIYTMASSGQNFGDIEVDVAGGKIYWSEGNRFKRSNLDGSSVQTLLDSTLDSSLRIPGKFIVDAVGGKIYFTSTSSTVNWSRFVYCMNLNGSNQEFLFEASTNSAVPNAMVADLALDSVSNKLYWTNTNGGSSIGRANLDGSNLQELIPDSAPGSGYRELQLDVAGGKMYWTANDTDRSIQRANLDGTGQETLINNISLAPGFDLDIPAGKMYWTNGATIPPNEGSIQRANLNGSNIETLISDLNISFFIHLPALSLSILPTAGSGWATAISAGPSNESAQTLSFEILTNSNPSLFAVGPSVSPGGVLTFTPSANANGTALISLVLHDSGGTANSGQDTSLPQFFSIIVNSVNDAPGGTNKTVTIAEDTPLLITASDFGFSDADGNLLNRVKITTLPALGTLKHNGVAISAGSFVTKAELDANQLTFTPPLNANGLPYTSFTFQVEDDGGTVGGGVNLDPGPNLLTINVLAVNDRPSDILLSNNSLRENAGANALIGILSGTDPDSGDSLIFSLPDGVGNNGLFNVSGSSLRANSSFNFESGNSYSVTVRATDVLGLTFDKVFNISVTNVTELNAIDVQQGQAQRSYIRYVDLIFDQASGLADLIANNRVQLTKRDLQGSNPVVMAVPGLSAVGTKLQLDFGSNGLGGNRNTTTGDGYYEIAVDMDGDGSYEAKQYFYRLLGDVNGDRKVDSTDASLILANYGGMDPNFDVNGDGVVNASDRTLSIRSNNRTLKQGLWIDD